MPTSLPFDPRAEELFQEYWARIEVGEPDDFDAICRANPKFEGDLRRLKDSLDVVNRLRPSTAADRPLSERFKAKFGTDRGLTQSLDDEPRPDSGVSSTLFDRLRGAGARGTRYKLLGEVARGGMGVILKIWDDELRRTLAMKVVLGRGNESKGDTPQVDPTTLGRFLEEAQVTGQLDHPGIVPVHELGLGADGRVYFTMRLVKGEDLRTIFEKVRTGEDGWNQVRALGVLLKVCEAMSYAHSKKVVHRDLKPANVMVGKFGEVYVMDWGLARVLGREDKHDLRIQSHPATASVVNTDRRERREDTPDSPLVTMDGDVVGTPSFMPPEQAKGQLDTLGAWSDVYSLGAMLYQLLTGEMPYVPAGAKVSQHTILDAVLRRAPDPIESLAPKTPPELVAICEKAMARSIPLRYPDTQEFAADLRAYLEGRVVRAYEAGTWAETRKWVRRNRPLAASLAAGVLVLVFSIIFIALLYRDSWELQTQDFVTKLHLKEAAETANHLKDEALAQSRELRVRGLIQDLAQFETLDDSLDYARSQKRPACEWWLERAHLLVDGRQENPATGQHWSPGSADVEQALVKLRAQARDATEAEQVADRTSHPRAKELIQQRAKLQWLARMLGQEPWPSEAEVEAELGKEKVPTDARELNSLAWPLVDPDEPQAGSEIRALILSRRAVAAADGQSRSLYRDTVAWALFRTGRFDEALAEERSAAAAIIGAQKRQLEGSLARMEREIGSWRGEAALKIRRAECVALQAAVDALESEVHERRTWRFADSEQEWWHAQLSGIVRDLGRLKEQIAIAERSVHSAEALVSWTAAIDAIASSEKYRGVKWPSGERLTPQIGLVPIGPDPASGLWEFSQLGSGDVAARAADGKIVLKPEMGLVFVLLPGGRVPTEVVEQGQKSLQDAALTKIDLAPFFFSKYELTNDQWDCLGGWRRASEKSEDPLLPVTNISWDDCAAALTRSVAWLSLPTEAQWEYGCRAGTTTSRWTGQDEASLRGAANIRFDKKSQAPSLQSVGLLRANPFGLNDVQGNAWEWCRDAMDADESMRQLTDGFLDAPDPRFRVLRGGSRWVVAELASSSLRNGLTPDLRGDDCGLRPVRGITP